MYANAVGRVDEKLFSLQPVEPANSDLLDRLATDHLMQRSVCALLGRIADDLHAPNRHYDAAAAHRYLTELLPRHVEREEKQLYWLLKRREYPGDDLDSTFDLLRAGHRDTRALGDELTDGLAALAGGGLPRRPNEFIVTVHAFTRLLGALIAWEDEAILPYARMRV